MFRRRKLYSCGPGARRAQICRFGLALVNGCHDTYISTLTGIAQKASSGLNPTRLSMIPPIHLLPQISKHSMRKQGSGSQMESIYSGPRSSRVSTTPTVQRVIKLTEIGHGMLSLPSMPQLEPGLASQNYKMSMRQTVVAIPISKTASCLRKS